MQHVITALVENRPGVLARVAGLFSARGYNIASLAVCETHDPNVSRMTLVTEGDDRTIEQINKQLNRLVDVIKVQDLTQEPHIERGLLLIKVKSTPESRSQIVDLVGIFRGNIIDYSPRAITIEVVGDPEKLDAFVDLMRGFGIHELARTGRIVLPREKKRK